MIVFSTGPPVQYRNENMPTSQPELLLQYFKWESLWLARYLFSFWYWTKNHPVRCCSLYQVDCASSSVPLKRVTRKVTTPTRSFWIDLKIFNRKAKAKNNCAKNKSRMWVARFVLSSSSTTSSVKIKSKGVMIWLIWCKNIKKSSLRSEQNLLSEFWT